MHEHLESLYLFAQCPSRVQFYCLFSSRPDVLGTQATAFGVSLLN